MRSFLLVILSCVILGAAFFGYSQMQGTPVAVRDKTVSAEKTITRPPGGNKISGIGRGDGVWIEIFDENTGLLVRRLRSARYVPQKNGLVLLTDPEAEFYMPNHQVPAAPVLKMHLTGLTGEVVVPESPASSKNLADQPPPASPSRGQIFTVTIKLYNLFADSVPGVEDETIHTNNIQFDNETMLISTESYKDDAGNTIAADQVPVHMRSNSPARGYDMDGRGLRLRWNDKDGRLDLLEIAHGEELIIKDTANSGAFGKDQRTPNATAAKNANTAIGPAGPAWIPAIAENPRGMPLYSGSGQISSDDRHAHASVRHGTQATASTQLVVPYQWGDVLNPSGETRTQPLPLALAANTPATAGDAIPRKRPPAQKKPEPPPVPVPYVATFYDNVRITQGQEILITANQMDVDFVNRQENAGPATRPTTEPETQLPNRSSQHSQAAANTEPAAQPADSQHASATTLPATQAGAATQPTTQPAGTPIVIHWTGKLLMLPAKPDRPKVAPGDAIIALSGAPVIVRRTPAGQDGDDIRSARVIYHTADGRVKLLNADSLPQVVISKLVNGQIDPKTTITTSTLDYAGDADGKKFAVLTGPGHALVPMASDEPATTDAGKGMMDAHWKTGAKVYFAGRSQNELAVEHVDLFGDVDVNNPQLILKSQELGLFFEPPTKPTTRPAKQPAEASAAKSSAHRTDAAGAASEVNPSASSDARDSGHHSTTQPAKPDAKPQPELRRVLAKQAVHCELAGQNGKKQIIDSNILDMRTAHGPDGKLFARKVDAYGSVHAHDPDQDLTAGNLQITLKPAAPKTPVDSGGMGGPPMSSPENHGRAARATDSAEPGAVAKTPAPSEPVTAGYASANAAKSAAPETRPAKPESDTSAAELDTMFAWDNVKVINKEGSIATGDELHVTTENNQTHVRLTGVPARIIDAKKNIITGPLITVEPKDNLAHVYGAGTMHVLQEQADGSRPKPMDMAWTDRADLNGGADRIDIYGNVALVTLDSDGTVNTASGQRIRVDLMKKVAPATRPAAQPDGAHAAAEIAAQPAVHAQKNPQPVTAHRPAEKAAQPVAHLTPENTVPLAAARPAATAMKPATRPADPMQMDLMKDKDVRTITIDGNSRVDSKSKAADGTLLREFSLFAPRIIYQLADSKELAAKTVLVPSAGRMLVQDHRPPEKAKPNENGEKGDNDETGNRGDTAFQWSRQLIYSEAAHRAIMTGDVLIVHKDLDPKQAGEGPVHITADEVTALFEPQTAAKSDTRPAGGPDQAALGLKHLNAAGHVVVTRASGARLNGDHIDYDPKTHWMTVFGTDARPAHYEDPDPHKRPMTAREFQWNTQSWEIKGENASSPNPR